MKPSVINVIIGMILMIIAVSCGKKTVPVGGDTTSVVTDSLMQTPDTTADTVVKPEVVIDSATGDTVPQEVSDTAFDTASVSMAGDGVLVVASAEWPDAWRNVVAFAEWPDTKDQTGGCYNTDRGDLNFGGAGCKTGHIIEGGDAVTGSDIEGI